MRRRVLEKIGKESVQRTSENPEVYALRQSAHGWKLRRRDFLAGAVAAGAVLTGKRSIVESSTREKSRLVGSYSKYDYCQDPSAHFNEVGAVAVSPDGSLLASGSFDSVKLWSLPMCTLNTTLEGHETFINCIAFTPDGKWLITANSNGEIFVWSMQKSKLKKNVKAHHYGVWSLAITPDSKRLVSVGNELSGNPIKLWSLPKLKLIKRWGGSGSRAALAISPDGKMLASDHSPEEIALWSLQKGKEGKLIRTIDGISSGFRADHVAFSQDGKYLVAAAGNRPEVYVWSMPDGKLKKSFNAHSSGVNSLSINKKGNRLATGSFGLEEYVKLWRLPNGKLLKTLGENDERFQGRAVVVFDKKKDLLYAGYSTNHALRAWGAKSGKLKRCFIDINVTSSTKYGRSYEYLDEGGKKVTVTVPGCSCAPKVPSDAVCTCDVVKGKVGGGGCGVVYYYPN